MGNPGYKEIVKWFTKAMTESSPGHNNPSFLVNSRKNYLGKEKS